MFVFRYIPDLSLTKTPNYQVKLETIESGSLKGAQYFIPEANWNKNEGYVSIDRGSTCTEFLKLDSSDPIKLLRFQNRYGQLRSLLWTTGYLNKCNRFASMKHRGIVPERFFPGEEEGYDLSLRIHEYLRDSGISIIFPVSVEEVEASVSNLQSLIRSTIRVREGKSSLLDVSRTEFFFDVANMLIQEKFPSCEYVEDDRIANAKVRLPLAEALIIDHLSSLNDSEAYKRCKNCGCIFQYKDGSKRSGALYCSASCQEEAKWKRQNQRRKAKRTDGSNGKR